MNKPLIALAICLAAIVGHLCPVGTGTGSGPTNDRKTASETPKPAANSTSETPSNGLVLHEWGTFTSFSGSNGVPVTFYPNNTDLPDFVYHHGSDPGSKANILHRYGTISMETPVIYFYTQKEMSASIRVDFPKGWITDWYPCASTVPGLTAQRQHRDSKVPGETIQWNVKLLPGEPAHFPRENSLSPYHLARETDAVPLQTEFEVAKDYPDEHIRGRKVAQQEKFLFYRGVGTFPPPIGFQALGAGKVRVKNTGIGKTAGLVLLVVHNGQIGFRKLEDLDAGAESIAAIPEPVSASTSDVSAVVVQGLVSAGLYEREAQAMVKTWDAAWFREEGMRLLYLVPRTRTDELLPLTVEPRPSEVVRVLVGRHDFLTPEQEAIVDRQAERMEKARTEVAAAEEALAKLGRFSPQAQQMALKRLEAQTQK